MSVLNVLRCKRDMGFWSYFSGSFGSEVRTLYLRLCDSEGDLNRPYLVTSASGVRADVVETWDWCTCNISCCVGCEASSTERARSVTGVATQLSRETLRQVFEEKD